MTNPLKRLNDHGQSVWYDNLNRELLDTGKLQRMVEEDGVSGGTSNPSIFEKAITNTDYYDEDLIRLERDGASPEEAYDDLTVADVSGSADVFRPIYDRTEGADGYASLEVSPDIANDTKTTLAEADRLFKRLDHPNVMIKIPGTQAGLPAIEKSLIAGVNINITLLFGVENYEQVALAYIAALENRHNAGLQIDRISSVASFFVSRVDTLVDEKLGALIEASRSSDDAAELKSLLGKAGIANAKIAYAKFQELFSGPRWEALAQRGARVQRCLWASTSTKNPDYRDVMYVDGLIGPDTINTLPQNTLDAFREHGVVERTLDKNVDEAFDTIKRLEAVGIDFRGVTDELQTQGVQLFIDSFRKANESIANKRAAITAGSR